MKNKILTLLFVVTFFAVWAPAASARGNDTIKVGLRYGSTAMFSANLENAVGAGYTFGYFDDDRDFISLGETEETAISMTVSTTMYLSSSGTYSDSVPSGSYRTMGSWHGEIDGFSDFDEAAEAAEDYGGYPAWIDGEYVVRVGCYTSRAEAEAAGDGRAVRSSSTAVLVTRTRSTDVLFEFDSSGIVNLAVEPNGRGEESVTWFRGYKYPGAFEYPRVTGGNLMVLNVVDLESYVKGVIPYEMNGSWPVEALMAQAVCARTFACGCTKHRSTYGFDVCNTTDCQVYYGRGSGTTGPSSTSDRAVDLTAGECMYYQGSLAKDAVYHSSNGGATEDAANVWGGVTGYLIGKEDPYEDGSSIPNYRYSVTYTADQLSWILDQKGYGVGTVQNVYISEYTAMGNVRKVTFVGSGGTKTVSGDTCRTIFYSSTYGKSVPSLRFTIGGGSGAAAPSAGVYVNNSRSRLSALEGAYAISGGGSVSRLEGSTYYAVDESGRSALSAISSSAGAASSASGSYTITGAGSGHNVGLSQYGAKAMAEDGYDYEDILHFYYTDVTIK